MKARAALFLQAVVVLVGIAALAFLVWEPLGEGRNARASVFQIYFNDPFLAYAYVGSTPFFFGLHRASGMFGHVRRNGAFSRATLDSLRVIRRCAMALIGFVAAGVVFVTLSGDKDDRPVGAVMGLLLILCAGVVAVSATLCGRHLQNRLKRPEAGRGI